MEKTALPDGCNEAGVLREAIALFNTRGGFTPDAYFDGPFYSGSGRPSQNVASVCAIGGVEQAIWKLCDEDVTDQRKFLAYTRSEEEVDGRLSAVHVLYGRVMGRLNRIARERYSRRGVNYIETVTTDWSRPTAKKNMLSVFEQALEEVKS